MQGTVEHFIIIVVQSLVYTFTNYWYTLSTQETVPKSMGFWWGFLNQVQILCDDILYLYIHSISTLYWNLCSGLFIGITKCDHF